MISKAPPIPIRVDTREQMPYRFTPGVCTVEVGTLRVGDYSIVGAETRIALERKSLQDYVGSITHGRDRFLRELEKLRRFEFAAIIVEGSIEDLRLERYRSTAGAASILGTTWARFCRYVPIVFAGDRVAAQCATEGLLRRWWLDEQEAARLRLAALPDVVVSRGLL